jgi:23S rRNA (uracil1939-C5)-methyltransferase
MSEIVQLEISDVAFGGAGVARLEGKVYFVPFTAPGDVVRARVTKDKKKFAEAELESIVTPSPARVPAPCPYFTKCGGCAYQHLAYPEQLALKQRQVEQTLLRVGRLESVPMQPIVPSPLQYGFRHRIRVHVSGGRTGFFAHGSHQLVAIDRCALAEQEVNESLQKLRTRPMPDGDYTLAAARRGDFFEQTNDGIAKELLALAERSVTPGRELLVDAYCGAGFFARHLAPRFKRVIGIEENEQAIEYARRRAGDHERYLAGDVGALIGEVLASNDPATTSVIVDPPAVGLAPRVVELLQATAPSEILYISCNPATLARDLAALVRTHRLESVTPLDMFPQTAEIEALAVLRR